MILGQGDLMVFEQTYIVLTKESISPAVTGPESQWERYFNCYRNWNGTPKHKHIQGGATGCEGTLILNTVPSEIWGAGSGFRREKDKLQRSYSSNTWRSITESINHCRTRICFPTCLPNSVLWSNPLYRADIPHPGYKSELQRQWLFFNTGAWEPNQMPN